MQLSKQGREQLADELQYIAGKMKEESDIFSQLYFFSAGFGMAGRLLNQKWDAQLCLIHLVLQATYGAINNRIQSLASGRDRAVEIPKTLISSLIAATEELGDIIRKERHNEILSILARFSEISYAATGNGYYLFIKGDLKL